MQLFDLVQDLKVSENCDFLTIFQFFYFFTNQNYFTEILLLLVLWRADVSLNFVVKIS
jgi:hypothetical protein